MKTTQVKMLVSMDANETYFAIKKTSKKMKHDKINILGSIAQIIPADTATPFPPLNLRKIEKQCPKTRKSIHIVNSKDSLNIVLAIKTPKKPFKVSNNNVITPGTTPATLNTFVAPGLQEPCFNISILLKRRVIITADGIEPIR